jgi:hypothetical protein
MYVKKAISLIGLLIAAVGISFAQVLPMANTSSAPVTDNLSLNVRLRPIQTIEVATSQKLVNIDYITRADYENGVASTQPNHLTIYSTGGFVVSVSSSEDYIENNYSANSKVNETINAASITVKASDGSNPLTGVLYSASGAPLSKEGAVLFSKGSGGVDKNFNIVYTAANLDAYIDKQVNGEIETVYSTTVTYTIAAF